MAVQLQGLALGCTGAMLRAQVWPSCAGAGAQFDGTTHGRCLVCANAEPSARIGPDAEEALSDGTLAVQCNGIALQAPA